VFTAPVRARPAGNRVILRWQPASDDHAVAVYRIFRDGRPLGWVGTHIHRVRVWLPCGTHIYRVQAVDSVGQTGSEQVIVNRKCNRSKGAP
jgi:hypothetical protein